MHFQASNAPTRPLYYLAETDTNHNANATLRVMPQVTPSCQFIHYSRRNNRRTAPCRVQRKDAPDLFFCRIQVFTKRNRANNPLLSSLQGVWQGGMKSPYYTFPMVMWSLTG